MPRDPYLRLTPARHLRGRSTLPRRARLGSVALAAACAALLAMPGSVPTGQVLDVVSDAGAGTTTVPGTMSPSAGGLPVLYGDLQSDPAMTSRSRPTAPPIASLAGYVWPLAHPRLTLPFGPSVLGSRLVDGQAFHDGVDLATFCGDPIGAAHAGTVLAAGRRYDEFMGWIGDLGPYLARLDAKGLWMTLPIVVAIDDGNGYRSVYAHFGRVVVKAGQQVQAGQLLGYEGATGRATGCHLHYGLFSPLERATFAIEPGTVERMLVPGLEIARVDPLLVLPPRPGINAPSAPPLPATLPQQPSPSPASH